MKNPQFVALAGILLFACSPSSKITVTNLHDLAAYQENSMIYALPRTRLIVNIEVVQHDVVPGPYKAYAEMYLGLQGVPQSSKTEYELTEMELKVVNEADPDYYYALTSSNPGVVMPGIFRFCDQGLMLDEQHFIPFSVYRPLNKQSESDQFTDLSVKRYIVSNPDKKEKNGGKEPLELNKKQEGGKVKSLEQKAKEASDFIFKIRKRRFKLLAGQYDVFPQGEALAASIKELNKLESEYLSLFIGKRYMDTLNQSFSFVPKSSQEMERAVICRFSTANGIADASSSDGKPLVLELRAQNYTNALKQVQFPQTGPVYEEVIFYRLPEKVSVRLFFGSRVIIESEESVFQYGPLVPVSTSLLEVSK